MAKNQPASDFLKQLGLDPEYQKMKNAQESKFKETEKEADSIEKPILEDLSKVGLDLQSLSDLINIKTPLPDDAVMVLVNWLQRIDNRFNIQEMIIRGFTGQNLRFDHQVLSNLYDQNPSKEFLRFAIANCIAESKISGISPWIEARMSGGDMMILFAASRHLSSEKVIPHLIKNFDKKDDGVYKALGEIGGQSELKFMVEKADSFKGHAKKEIKKAIQKIKKRLSSS